MNILTTESDRSLSIACITNNVGVNGQNPSASEQFLNPVAEERYAQYQYLSDEPPKPGDALTAALSYAARGWPVVPLHSPRQDGCSCKSRTCHSIGKHPRTRRGLKDASTNPNQIRRWFEKWPDANVGILTGKESGLVVLDVDDKGEGKGSDTLAALLEANEDATTTMIVRTGNGRHIYYRHPGGSLKNSVGQLGVGLDIRADGGYVVAAPSRHANGEIYTVEQDLEVEQPPVWLLAMIEARRPDTCAIELVPRPDPSGQLTIIEGSRNNELFKIACRLRGREGMEKRDLERIMLSYNEAHCVPPLSVGEVLRTVASACGFPAEKSAEKSLRRQNENPLWWFRFDVRNWHSDQRVNAMSDYQTGWYMRLIVFAWSKGGYLTADMSQLWRLAGAKSRKQFERHCKLVLMDFELVTEHDGDVVLRHRYMAAEYAVTLKKWMKKINSGEIGAKTNAELYAVGNPLLDNVHAAELVGNIHAAAELMEIDDQYRGVLGYLEAAGDEVFEPLLHVKEAAKLLLMHPKTLQALARAGAVPCVRMGKYWRFRASSLDAWFRNRLEFDYQSRRASQRG